MAKENNTVHLQFNRVIPLNKKYDDYAVLFAKSELKFVIWSRSEVLVLDRIGNPIASTHLETDSF